MPGEAARTASNSGAGKSVCVLGRPGASGLRWWNAASCRASFPAASAIREMGTSIGSVPRSTTKAAFCAAAINAAGSTPVRATASLSVMPSPVSAA